MMKAIRRFLSPSDTPEPRASLGPRRSVSMRFLSAPKPRPASQYSSTSIASSHSQVSSRISSVSRSTARGGAYRRRGTGAIIDAEDYPRVIATIMQNASRPALLKLRLVSRSFRDMADAQLARHLVLCAPVGVSSLRVTSPSTTPSIEHGIPGLSVRVLWNRDERRRLTRILTGTRVVDLRGPSRARDSEIADLTLQCSCARTVRLRPDAAGNPPTACPLPPRATQLIAFTTLAGDGSPVGKASRRSSWLVTDSEHLQPAATAYVGPVPNLIQSLVVTVRYPRSADAAAQALPPRPIRPLAPWDHPQSLRAVTVIFVPEQPAPKPRPRSFLSTGPAGAAGAGGADSPTPIFQQRSTYREASTTTVGSTSTRNKRFSWLTNSPVSPTFPPSPTSPTTPISPVSRAYNFNVVDPSFPATPVPSLRPSAPAIVFSDADAERTGNIGFLTPFIRSVAAHLPRIQYTLVDVSRIDPAILGLPHGTLMSPRQVERLITKALRAEMLYTGWDAEEIADLFENLVFTSRGEYAARVGAAAFELQTVE